MARMLRLGCVPDRQRLLLMIISFLEHKLGKLLSVKLLFKLVEVWKQIIEFALELSVSLITLVLIFNFHLL